jgi:rhodanese-related sulfurtransferase
MTDESLKEVGPHEAAELVAGGAYLLDVREPDEWAAGRAPHAHHIPLGQLQERYREVPTDVTVVCVCAMGVRSARAAEALAGAGYSTVNLAGGMRAWLAAELPIVADGGPGSVL